MKKFMNFKANDKMINHTIFWENVWNIITILLLLVCIVCVIVLFRSLGSLFS